MATLIYSKSTLPPVVLQLKQHLNEMLYPYSFPRFKYHNSLKDILSVAHALEIKFLLQMVSTTHELRFNLAKVPQGPTLSFEVVRYFTFQKQPQYKQMAFSVFTNFDDSPGAKFAKEMLKQVLPAAEQSEHPYRVILVNYEADTKIISLRHYFFHETENTAKILYNLRQHRTNFSQFYSFDELAETGKANPLQEIGPRVDLRLVKVESGVLDGVCLLNEKVDLSPAEAAYKRAGAEARQKAQQAAEKQSKKLIYEHAKREVEEKKRQEEEEKRKEEKEKEDALLAEEEERPRGYEHITRKERYKAAQTKREQAEKPKEQKASRKIKARDQKRGK